MVAMEEDQIMEPLVEHHMDRHLCHWTLEVKVEMEEARVSF